MTLQELIGELLTLSNAYPDKTPVTVQFHEYRAEITGLIVESQADAVSIRMETQA